MFTKVANNRLSAIGDPASSVIKNVLENAKKFGKLPQELVKELSERESIVSQLLVTVPDEAKIEKYFTDFLFVYNIPWSKTRELMTKALGAPVNGANVEAVLDFALEHYKRKRNISQTKQIIEDGLKLQSTSRLMNVFQMLNDALQNKPSSMTAVQFNPDSMKDMFVFNRLLGLTFAKPEEDLEMLRREFVTSLDELERTREVDDRYKAIFQTLQSIEFNEQLTNITKFVTNLFEIQTRDPAMLAFRRVLVQLKLGIEFRRQFFSDFESETTSKFERDKSGDPGEETRLKDIAETFKRSLGKDEQYNFVRIAQTAPTQDKKTLFDNFLNDVIEKLAVLKVGLETAKNNPGDPAFQTINPALKQVLGPALNVVDSAISKVNTVKNGLKDATFTIEESFNKFNEIWNTLGSNLVVTFKSLPDDLPFLKNIEDFAKAFGIEPKVFTNIFGFLIGAQTVTSLLTGNFKTGIMGALSLIAANENYKKVELSKIVGIEVPKSEFTVDTRELAAAFRELGANQDQLNDLITLDAYAKSVRATIQDREQTLVSKMTTAIKTNSNSQIDAPLAANKDIQQEYSRFYEYLKVVNNNLSYYMDLMSALVMQTRTDPKNEKKLLQNTGTVLENRAKIEALITDVRSKLAKYKSYALVVANVQKRNRLIMELQVLIPEIEKYMETGISIADLFLQPSGLSDKMKEMVDSLIEDRDKLFSEMEKVKKIQKVPVRFRRGPKPSQNTGPEYLGNNQEEAMNPKYSPEYLGDDQNESMNPLYSTAKGIPPSFSSFEDRPK